MKFGALLKTSAREMPDLQGLFNCYKQLKKRLKRLPEKSTPPGVITGSTAIIAHERAFVALLISDIQAFNERYVEKEEESVIKLSLLEERLSQAQELEQKSSLYKDFVNFHGQTLMLVHWSILAYTSVLKILKKHHKRTGLQIQEFSMQQLLAQPFCSVELASELVRKAEAKAQELAAALKISPARTSASFASSHSSPVAGELMTAARESVQGISASAARGNQALEEHLTAEPSSSEDGSVELGEAEVVSGRNTAALNGPQQDLATQLPSPGLTIRTEVLVGKRSRSRSRDAEDQHDAKRGRQALNRDSAGATQAARAQCDCLMKRTMSVASENKLPTPISLGHCPDGQEENRQPLNETRANGSQNGAHSAVGESSDSKSRSKSPPLTMGQGWHNGTSENILRQTQMALGLWEQLHDTAATPSTVVPPLKPRRPTNHDPANSAA